MSAKTSSQPGRRTPLTLTGTSGGSRPQQQFNKNSSGPNGNSGPNVKNDNKSTNQKTEATLPADTKETMQKDIKKQQNVEKNVTENTKKPEKPIEKKTENGGNKNNVNTKDKLQIGSEQNGNNPTKDKREKQGKADKTEKPTNKEANKDKEEKREDKKEKAIEKKSEKMDKNKDKKAEREPENKAERDLKPKKVELEAETEKSKLNEIDDEKMEVIVIDDILATPPKGAAVPTKLTPKEKPASVTPKKVSEKNTTPVKATTTIEDVEMEPLTVEPSPAKAQAVELSLPINIAPDATSTPGKALIKRCAAVTKSEIQLAIQSANSGSSPDRNSCPRTFSAISGRRSIRPISDFTSSQFQNNSQFRESYRRINTELDVTSNTNTSLNVTVGSEIPNNSSFSFFGRGRKRDRTPPNSQSAIDLHTDVELSPPKRPRLEGFFNAVASPLSLLRSRFSKTTIQSSTPMKLRSKLAAVEDESEVQNVSGISIEEEIPNVDGEEPTATEEVTVGNEAGLETPKKGSPIKEGSELVSESAELQVDIKCGLEKSTYNVDGDGENTDDIKFTETPIGGAVCDPAKNKKCSIM